MFEAVLQRLNTPDSDGTYFTREPIDEQLQSQALTSLNKRLKAGEVFGEFNPPDPNHMVLDKDNVCLKVHSAFISDGCLMGLIEPTGPQAGRLQEILNARQFVTLKMRAVKEQRAPASPGRVTKISEIFAFDLVTH